MCYVSCVSVLVCRSTEREVTEGSLVWPITCSLFVDNKVLFIFSLFFSVILCSFVFTFVFLFFF